MLKLITFASLFVLCLAVDFTFAQKILSFDMSVLTVGNEDFVNSHYNDPNLGSSILSHSDNISALDETWTTVTGYFYDPGLFNSYKWEVGSSINLDDYIEFTLTPNSGYQLAVNSIKIKHERNNDGPVFLELRTSADNYTTNIGGAYDIPHVDDRPIVTTFDLNLPKITTPLIIRLYAYGSRTTYGTWGIGRGARHNGPPPTPDDHIIVNGFVIAENSPSLFTTKTSLQDFYYLLGSGPSVVQSFNLIGTNLIPSSGTLGINGTSDYEFSTDSLNFSSTLNLPYSSNSLMTPIFVRLKSGLAANDYKDENINISGGGVALKRVNCNGFVTQYNLIINEVMASSDGYDTNNDGDNSDRFEDQFIELVNIGTTDITLTNFKISKAGNPAGIRHSFSTVTLTPNEAIVVFGGGSLVNFDSSPAQTASVNGGLRFLDSGDSITISDDSYHTVAVFRYNNEGAYSQSLARNPDFVGPFVQHTTISTNPVPFSPGRRNTDGVPLPVELSEFSAVVIQGGVKLEWRTETEVQNYGFDVLRRAYHYKEWTKIGFVEGRGNSNTPHEYSFTDLDPTDGSKFEYRLKQNDTDGKFEYSEIIFVDLSGTVKFELSQNYPNPFNPTTTIKFGLKEKSNVKIDIFNIIGEKVKTVFNEVKEPGNYQLEFNANNLTSGTYIYRIIAGNYVETRKMILMK